MTPEEPAEIVCAHSPDSDDAYMFYGLATKKIRSRLVGFRHVLEDIESLNQKAMEGRYELTAISYHVYPYVADKYVLMASGSSVGDGYGPVLVSSRPLGQSEVRGKRIAVPGLTTTAYLALKVFEADIEAVAMPFDKVLEAVADHTVDLGLVIHEGQLTYSRGGLHKVLDLGAWWKAAFHLPLPLGANALLRSLGPEIRSECCRMVRESVHYALENHEEALNYAMNYARDTEPRLAEKFIGMYVNQYTVDGGEMVARAAQKLFDVGYERGLLPCRAEAEFTR
jgi:1,4-dihydroxy-6-naphthoate synthase